MEQITKREIFEKMSTRFGVPNRMPMARAARFLHENGYTPNALHYARMLDLLRDLDEFIHWMICSFIIKTINPI